MNLNKILRLILILICLVGLGGLGAGLGCSTQAEMMTTPDDDDTETDPDVDPSVDEETDTDSDGIADSSDNCPTTSNQDQEDTDSDGTGDACDGDVDGDGSTTAEGDCDDSNSSVGPATAEACDNVDNDCDDQVDEGFTTSTYYQDADGDSYGTVSVTVTACAAFTGYVSNDDDCNDSSSSAYPGATETYYDGIDQDCNGADVTDADGDTYASTSVSGGTDCNDSSSSINPGATEVAYDGIDQDCSGADKTDADGDGYSGTSASGGTDCDDDNAEIYPTATEVFNFLDDNCDGVVDIDELTDSNFTFVGEDADDYLGYRVSSAGDVNGDGHADFLITAPYVNSYQGKIYLFFGSENGFNSTDTYIHLTEDHTPNIIFTGENTNDYAGFSYASLGDVNEDGADDFLIGAYSYDDGTDSGAGKVYLIYGDEGWNESTSIEVDLDPASLAGEGIVARHFIGPGSNAFLGYSVSGVGDFNNDGCNDYAMGASGYDQGKVYLFLGCRSRPLTVDLASYASTTMLTYEGENTGDSAGSAIAFIGDVDGDDVDDFAVGAKDFDDTLIPSDTSIGKVYVVLGTDSYINTNYLVNADVSYEGQEGGDWAGHALAGNGDFDGDGYSDFAIGAYKYDATSGVTNSGKVYVVFGSADIAEPDDTGSTIRSLDDIELTFLGGDSNDYAGYALTFISDLDNDGKDELLIGARGADSNGTDAGTIYAIKGDSAITGNQYLDYAADATIIGGSEGEGAGYSIAASGDINDRGKADILIGAASASDDDFGDQVGKVYLVYTD